MKKVARPTPKLQSMGLQRQSSSKFDTDEYQVLVGLEKYQTGFRPTKLVHVCMWTGSFSGLQAVQTLARLNRTHPAKKNTYVLDFRNSIEDIKEAFRPFFETTTLEEYRP